MPDLLVPLNRLYANEGDTDRRQSDRSSPRLALQHHGSSWHSSSSSSSSADWAQNRALTGSSSSWGSGSSRRKLQQQDHELCPVGCVDGACVQDSTQTRLRCLKCDNNLVVDRITGLCGKSRQAI